MGRQRRKEDEIRAEAEAGNLPTFLFSLGIAVLLYGFLSGVIRFWDTTGVVLIPAFRYSLIAGLPLALAGLVAAFASGRELRLDPGAFILILAVACVSDWLCREFSLLQGPSIRGPIIVLSLLSMFLLWQHSTMFLRVVALAAPLVLIWAFFDAASGRLLFSDDHPSMLYRLQMLKENFPAIPSYNTTWNSGFDNRDFFATGVLNVFFLFSPLIYFSNVLSSYNLIVALLFFVAVPLATYLAAKCEELPDPVPSLSAALSLCTSLLWYRWCLNYGAIGFVTSAALVPLSTVLVARVLSRSREMTAWHAALLVISLTLMLLWSLSGLMLLPLLLAGLLQVRRVLHKRYMKSALLALVALNLPWVLVFLSVSSVGTFISLSRSGKEPAVKTAPSDHNPNEHSVRSVRGGVRSASITGVLKHLRETSGKINPLIIFLSVPGFFMLERRSTRSIFLLVAAWLLLLGTVGASLKPQLELERALIVLGLVAVIPVALVIGSTIRRAQYVRAGLLCGLLFAGLLSVSSAVYGRSQEQYAFADDLVFRLSQAIKSHGGEGRTVFSGFMLHDLSRGHIAPLTLLSGKPLVASGPFHSVWWYTDVIPSSYRKRGVEGIEEFLDLQNATAVVSRERKWRAYFDRHPERYVPVFRESGFSLYRRMGPSSYFLRGGGEILSQSTDELRVRVDSGDAVLKFNYFPFLQSTACRLSAEAINESIEFIRVSDCPPGTVVGISARNAFSRLLGAE